MKIKVKDCYTIASVMAELSAKELPIKAAYWVKRIGKFIDSELRTTEEIRISVFTKRNIELDQETNTYKIAEYLEKNPSEKEKMDKENSDLMEDEIEYPFDKLKLGLLGDIKISARVLAGIDPILDGDGEE